MSEQPLIALSGITKTYGQGPAAFQALSGVDLVIDAGEFVAIMGPSGSGKSTAMNILGCLDTRTSMEIMELISGLNRDRGITVLMVTHEPDMAEFARRVVRFVDGRVESDTGNGGNH